MGTTIGYLKQRALNRDQLAAVRNRQNELREKLQKAHGSYLKTPRLGHLSLIGYQTQIPFKRVK